MTGLQTLDEFLRGSAAERLGWILLHSVWQFLAVAVLAGVALRLLARASSSARYFALTLALAVAVLLPVATWFRLASEPAGSSAPGITLPNDRHALPESPSPLPSTGPARTPGFSQSFPQSAVEADVSIRLRLEMALRPWLSWVVAVWTAGVLLCSLRPLLGWRMMRRLRRVGSSPVSDEVLAALARVSTKLGMRRTVPVLQSTLARTPMLIGCLRPVILLPVSFLTSVPVAELEAILAHELAHARRHDFVVNLVQALVETVFFYHPAVWWLSHRLRNEREICCDDMVVRCLDDRLAYGRALLAVAELQSNRPSLALGAKAGSLPDRIRRILDSDPTPVRSFGAWEVRRAATSVILTAFALVALTVFLATASAEPPQPNAPAEKPQAHKGPLDKHESQAKKQPRKKLPPQKKKQASGPWSMKCVVVDADTDKPVPGKKMTINMRFFKEGKDQKQEILSDWFWGPKSPSEFDFFIPKAVMKSPDLDLILVEWGARHPDYEPFGTDTPVPVLSLINDDPKSARESLCRIKLKKKQRDQLANINERKATLHAKKLPMRKALEQLAESVEAQFVPDEPALKSVKFDLDAPVSATIDNLPLGVALGQLIEWPRFSGLIHVQRGNQLVLTTINARKEFTLKHVPDWMKEPVRKRELQARLGEGNQVVSVSAGRSLTEDFLRKLATLPKLREIQFTHSTTLPIEALARLSGLTHLEKATMSGQLDEATGRGDAAIAALSSIESLRDLYIHECGTTDAGAKLLEKMPQLTHLRLYQEGHLTDAALVSIGKLRNLKSLDLTSYVGTVAYGRMYFTENGTRHLAALKKLEILRLAGHDISAMTLSFPKLTSLAMGGRGVSDDCAAQLPKMTQLKNLSLSFSSITNEGMKHVAALKNLKRFSLNSSVVTDKGIALLTRLPLVNLELRASKITDTSLSHIAKIKPLARLDISGSGLSGARMGSVISAHGLRELKSLPNLQTLWINNLKSVGVGAALAEVKSLRLVTLMMVSIGEEELDQLSEALPEATIQYITGGSGSTRLPKKYRDLQPGIR